MKTILKICVLTLFFNTPIFAQNLLEWQNDYNFDKTSEIPITLPEPIGNEIVISMPITRQKIQDALDIGGKITFDTEGNPVTVYINQTLVVKKHGTVIDGGGFVTLDAQQERRIIYSVDAHHVTNPRFASDNVIELTWMITNMIFRNGRTTGGPLRDHDPPRFDGDNANDGSGNGTQQGSGGAIRSGLSNQCFVVNCHFFNNETTLITDEAIDVGGGGIYARGTSVGGIDSEMTVMDCYFEGNKATLGGCIISLLTNLNVIRCGFFNNFATQYGAGIYTDGGSSSGDPLYIPSTLMRIHASIFKDNEGHGQGGAVFLFVYGGTMEITETLFENNICKIDLKGDAFGGGLRTGNGVSKIQKCAFINNTAYKQGGGLWVGENEKEGHSNLIENCSFIENTAQEENTPNTGLGGAVMVGRGTSLFKNNTLVRNTAGQGGGIFGGANYTIQNTILYDNTTTNPWNQNHQIYIDVTFNDTGGNIQYLSPSIEVSSSNNSRLPNALDEDPLFEETLNRTDGFTPVLKLTASSPAIGIGVDCIAGDQILQCRGEVCDAGAVEFDIEAGICSESNSQVSTGSALDLVDASNLLTPNGDLRNDLWQIEGLEQVSNYTLRIFSKNGQIILETDNYQQDWAGKDQNGNQLPAGVYYYSIVVSGEKKPKTGYITIVY